jgi:hypothetical protein
MVKEINRYELQRPKGWGTGAKIRQDRDAATVLHLVRFASDENFLRRIRPEEVSFLIGSVLHRLENEEITTIVPKDPTELYEALFKAAAQMICFCYNDSPVGMRAWQTKEARAYMTRTRKSAAQRLRDRSRAAMCDIGYDVTWLLMFILSQCASITTQLVVGAACFWLYLVVSPFDGWRDLSSIVLGLSTGYALMWSSAISGIFWAAVLNFAASPSSSRRQQIVYMILYSLGWVMRFAFRDTQTDTSFFSWSTPILFISAALQASLCLQSISHLSTAPKTLILSKIRRRLNIQGSAIINAGGRFCRFWRLKSIWADRIGEIASDSPPLRQSPYPEIGVFNPMAVTLLAVVLVRLFQGWM